MGEAKRRRAAEAAATKEVWRSRSGLTWAEIEEIASEDPDDRAIRIAHGFTYDDWSDRSTLCRNGCGETYDEIAGGKMRACSAAKNRGG